jgi:hypothetical protein
MPIISRNNSIKRIVLFGLALGGVQLSAAGDLSIPYSGKSTISFTINKKVVATDLVNRIKFLVAPDLSRHLILADEVKFIGDASEKSSQLFIVLSREPSRPEGMGRGYCGAGYEDYLLLVELNARKLILRDTLLLQSCLNTTSMFVDHGDDNPAKLLIPSGDKSFDYRMLEDDDKIRKLTVKGARFKVAKTADPDTDGPKK